MCRAERGSLLSAAWHLTTECNAVLAGKVEMLVPVWPLKWLLGRSEAETAGQFASRVETGKGKNSKTSVVLEGSSLSPDMQFAKPFHRRWLPYVSLAQVCIY